MGIRTLAVPVACLVVGLLIGFLSKPVAPVVPPFSGEVEGVTRDAPGGTTETIEDQSPSPTDSPAPAPPQSEGTGRIEGRVVTPDGDPVAGVVVTACREAPSDKDGYFGFPEPNSSAGPPDLDRELAEELRKIERRSRFRAATRREAVTDRDGRFILDGLGMGYHRIYGFREGLSISNATDRVGSAPGDPVELVAEPVTPITVCVLDLDGEPADRAMVDFDGSEDRSVAWSPERNVFVVRTGYLTLTATAECERLASTPVMIEITDSPTDPVVLQLEARRGLEGTVAYPRGMDSVFHRVVALELPPGANELPDRLIEEGEKGYLDGEPGRTATYFIPDLPPGRYLVGVVDHPKSVLTSTLVTIGDRLAVLDFVLHDAGATEGGNLIRILGPDGTPEPFVNVNVGCRDARWLGKVERLEPGVFHVFARGVGGTCYISVSSKEYGYLEVEFDPESDAETTIQLSEPAFLEVVLPGYAGSRYEGSARIIVDRPGRWKGAPGFLRVPPGPDGRQLFGPYQPGEWEVIFWRSMMSTPLIRVPLTLVSGRQEVALDLPQIFHLDVLVEDEEGRKGFYLRRLDGPSGHSSPGPVTDGRFRFEGLCAGEYVLSRHLGPREHMPLTITGDRTVRFRPIVLDALRIEIADADGPLSGSGLKHGDLVLSIDGTKITGERQGWALLQAAVKKGRAALTVRRDGKLLSMEADLAGYRDPGKSGGEIRPWRR